MTPLPIGFETIAVPHLATHYLAFRELHGILQQRGMDGRFPAAYDLFHVRQTPEAVAEAILGKAPGIAAFSLHVWNLEHTRAVCRILRARAPAMRLLVGGPMTRYAGADLIAADEADAAVVGPGEDAFPAWLDRCRDGRETWATIPNLLYRQGGRVIATPAADHDVARDTYPLPVTEGEDEFFLYELSRGCPFQCRYCAWSAGENRRVQFRPWDVIERDLRAIAGVRRVEILGFCDADLFMRRELGLRVLALIHALNAEREARGWPPLKLIAELNPQFADATVIDAVAACPPAFMFSCGLQTIDETVNRDILNRPFERARFLPTLEQLYTRAGSMMNIEIIYGLPGETLAGFRRTLDYVLTGLKARRFTAFHFLVIPGSYFREHPDAARLEFEPRPPYRLKYSDTFSAADLETAGRLVFMLYVFIYLMRDVKALVDERIRGSRLAFYDALIAAVVARWPEFIDTFYPSYDEPNFLPVIENHMAALQALRPRVLALAGELAATHAPVAPLYATEGPPS